MKRWDHQWSRLHSQPHPQTRAAGRGSSSIPEFEVKDQSPSCHTSSKQSAIFIVISKVIMTPSISVAVNKHMLAFLLPNSPPVWLSESVSLWVSLSKSLYFSSSTKPPTCLQTSNHSSIVIVSVSYTFHFLFHYNEEIAPACLPTSKQSYCFLLPHQPTALPRLPSDCQTLFW